MDDQIKRPLKRNEEITQNYFNFLDQHLAAVIAGKTAELMQLHQVAASLCISHRHLTATVKHTTGQHPCYFYDRKILQQAQKMLLETDLPVAEIARILTYDPSNFSKFFKKLYGETPGNFRKRHRKQIKLS
ncbi:helix-turn-helix domain-containing protein [Mucilaginibacter lappiensis]|uniref:AraC-like DNA-binding protein n=1 Tax=Mucilaginibacter lappiensis TaxID=354630 RepID=A0A841JHV7_9SPHI|nr:helix-turn-helix domain-containing protein [Mucilaginibacter lappiensis]MBB6130753.1 AraC-like DNA-binding protein [Mucilaginibacter lappiensis]